MNGPRDDVALAVGELFVHLATLNVANQLHQDLLGRLGRDSAKVLGRRVPLARDVALEVEFESPHLDLSSFGIDLDFGVFGGVGTALVGRQQRVRERDQQLPFVNVLVARDLTEGLKKFEVRHS